MNKSIVDKEKPDILYSTWYLLSMNCFVINLETFGHFWTKTYKGRILWLSNHNVKIFSTGCPSKGWQWNLIGIVCTVQSVSYNYKKHNKGCVSSGRVRPWLFSSPLAPHQYTCKDLHWSSLHENVVFFVCVHIGNAGCIISIIWNSISGLDAR